jgi:hypothetical protein
LTVITGGLFEPVSVPLGIDRCFVDQVWAPVDVGGAFAPGPPPAFEP